MSEGTIAVVITVLTSVVFLALGLWYVGRRRISVEDFIVSRGAAGTGLATATLVASALGAWILASPAETGVLSGISALVGYGLGSAAPLLAFIVLGARMRNLMPEGHSVTEFVWHRFGPAMYYFTIAVVIFYMLVFLSAELTIVAKAVNLIGGTHLAITAIVVGLLTVVYTAYGGMRASLFTDRIQFYIIIPLLIVVIIAAIRAVNGLGDVLDKVSDVSPELLSPTHGAGIEFGVTLIIAILAAEMFNQGSWQRVYTMRDEGTLRKGFLIAGVVVLPVIFLTGMFGILAVGMDVVEDPSVAMISFVKAVMPFWSVVALLVLGIVLVMSSMDTMLNGITSTITLDIARTKPELGGSSLLRSSRAITVVLILPAIFIASKGYSVLYLFFIADLACAAAVFPVFYGLYSKRLAGPAAMVSALAGLVVGALFFPAPDFGPLPGITIPGAGRLVISFGAALGVSGVLSIAFGLVARIMMPEATFDFSRLREKVGLIEG